MTATLIRTAALVAGCAILGLWTAAWALGITSRRPE